MRAWLTFCRWQLTSALRELMPQTWLRIYVMVGGAALIGLGGYVGATMPLTAQRVALAPSMMIACMLVAFLFAGGASVVAAAKALSDSHRFAALEVAPRSPSFVVYGVLTVTAAASLVPVLVLAVMVSSMLVRIDPSWLAPFIGMQVIALAYAIPASVGMLLLLLRVLGSVRGPRAARGVGGALVGIGFVVLQPLTSLLRGQPLPFVALAALLVPLPWTYRRAANALWSFASATAAEVSYEPVWGSWMWWRRIKRSAVPWRLLAIASTSTYVLLAGIPGRHGIVGMLLLEATRAPLDFFWEDERRSPYRLRIAPAAALMRRRLWVAVGGSIGFATATATIGLGWAHPSWIAAVSVLAMAGAAATAISPRIIRGLVHIVLGVAAVFSEILWTT